MVVQRASSRKKGKAACLYGGTDERTDCCRNTSYTCTIPRWGVHLLNTNSIHVTGGRNMGGQREVGGKTRAPMSFYNAAARFEIKSAHAEN